MDTCTKELASGLPIRFRVALALAAVERGTSALRKTQALAPIERALRDAWLWEMGEPISARHLYDHVPRLSALESDCADATERGGLTERQVAAIHAAISAVDYVVWHARTEEMTRGRPTVGNDCIMAEMSEEVLFECLDLAARADAGAADWQGEATLRLVRASSGNVSTMGEAIPRDFLLEWSDTESTTADPS